MLHTNAEVALEMDRTSVHTEFLEEIVQESERMTRLVEDLLFLARSGTGSVLLELEVVRMKPFLAEIRERAAVLAHNYAALLRVEQAVDGLVQIDRTRIEQAVLILVDNAGKYSPAGKEIVLCLSLRGPEFVVEVTDQGPGIPAHDLGLVFERFYRVDKARTRKQRGSRLGLAIAKSITEAYGDRISVDPCLLGQRGASVNRVNTDHASSSLSTHHLLRPSRRRQLALLIQPKCPGQKGQRAGQPNRTDEDDATIAKGHTHPQAAHTRGQCHQ